jgi:succinyl-CoA synthetase beta subunit
VARHLLSTKIRGEPVARVLVEEQVAIARELYLATVVDRVSRSNTILASQSGGIDIEEVAAKSPEKIIRHSVDPIIGLQDYEARGIAHQLGYSGARLREMAKIVFGLYSIASKYDGELVESNPLVELKDGRLIAADMRILIDDNSLFRHQEFAEREASLSPDVNPLELRARRKGLAYVELDGSIGIIGNGAGLVMATLDMVMDYGGKPANFCDVGGGASKDRIQDALEIVMANDRVKVLLVNILGGITRCDDVAKAIVDTKRTLGMSKPLFIRLVGTNELEGQQILKENGIPFLSSMEEAARSAVAELAG